jgi:hypothetical protein
MAYSLGRAELLLLLMPGWFSIMTTALKEKVGALARSRLGLTGVIPVPNDLIIFVLVA